MIAVVAVVIAATAEVAAETIVVVVVIAVIVVTVAVAVGIFETRGTVTAGVSGVLAVLLWGWRWQLWLKATRSSAMKTPLLTRTTETTNPAAKKLLRKIVRLLQTSSERWGL